MKRTLKTIVLFVCFCVVASARFGSGQEKSATEVIPPDRVIPPSSIFGKKCSVDRSLTDGMSLQFVDGKPFRFDEFPYTVILEFENPTLSLTVFYYQKVEDAKKGFAEHHEANKNRGIVPIGPILTKENKVPFYTMNIFGRKYISVSRVQNVVFALDGDLRDIEKETHTVHKGSYEKFLQAGIGAKPSKTNDSPIGSPRRENKFNKAFSS